MFQSDFGRRIKHPHCITSLSCHEVVPRVVVGHTELEEIFELSLLPGGRLLPPSQHEAFVLSPLLLSACLTVVFLLLFLAIG